MAKDKKQIMLKRICLISKETCLSGICLFAMILIYAGYLCKYRKGYLEDYLLTLLKYYIVSIPLSYALWNFISGKERRKQMALGLFTAFFVLVLASLDKASDYWDFAVFFWPLVTTTCFLEILTQKSKSRKAFLLPTIPLALLMITIGLYMIWRGSFNLLIIPFWLIQFFCAAIYLTLAFGDYDKIRIRAQRLLIVFCLLQTWLIYEELLRGYRLIRLFQQIFILLWPVVVFAFFRLSERVKGIGRLLVYYIMVFGGMWLLTEPYVSDAGLKWEAVETLYLLLTANIVMIIENRRQRQDSKKMPEYGVIILINAGYLTFMVWSSHRIRNILHSLFNENNWGHFRMEALRANISGNPDAAIWRQVNEPLLSEMNLNAGIWLPIIIIALACLMIYFAGKSHCENKTAEYIKKYLCCAFLLRIISSVFSSLFLITSSLIAFPLLADGEADLAVMVMIFLCISYTNFSQRASGK